MQKSLCVEEEFEDSPRHDESSDSGSNIAKDSKENQGSFQEEEKKSPLSASSKKRTQKADIKDAYKQFRTNR